MMTNIIMAGIGGFFGAVARFTFSKWINQWFSSAIPFGTLAVNLIGSFLLGFLFGENIGSSLYLFLGTGFMGAFTTFSTFNIENIELYHRNEKKSLIIYLGTSYIGGVLLAFLGLIIGAK